MTEKERPFEESLLAALEGGCRRAGHRPKQGETIGLTVRAVAAGDGRWRLQADPPLEEQIDAALLDAAARLEVFRPGRVYCYRCDSSECGHAAPPAPGLVFAGYSPTGLPLWTELVQFLLDRRHPRADRLCGTTTRSLAAAFVDAATLKGRQLAVFGRASGTYDILGQVALGFLWFAPGGEAGGERERTALTLQAAVVRDRRRSRVVLNVLGRLGDGSEALERFEGHLQMRVLDVISSTRRQLGRLRVPGRRGAGRSPADEAAPLLRRAASALERLDRQSSRRTRHAEKRVSERRPTSRAFEDALGAVDERLLWDERASTVVVLGSHGRVHVFSPEGVHVTSLSLGGEKIGGRRRRGRWRPLGQEGRRLFRESLGRALEAGAQ